MLHRNKKKPAGIFRSITVCVSKGDLTFSTARFAVDHRNGAGNHPAVMTNLPDITQIFDASYKIQIVRRNGTNDF